MSGRCFEALVLRSMGLGLRVQEMSAVQRVVGVLSNEHFPNLLRAHLQKLADFLSTAVCLSKRRILAPKLC